MKVLSVRQPWASLIISGAPIFKSVDNGDGSSRVEFAGLFRKDVENRNWSTNFRGRICIHASRQREKIEAMLTRLGELGIAPMGVLLLFSSRYAPTGCLIGEVDIMDCVISSKSPWFEGPYGFVLANPTAYQTPIPYRGQLGLFDVPASVTGSVTP